jgi:hypothetical protein
MGAENRSSKGPSREEPAANRLGIADSVTCPSCGVKMPLSEALAAEVEGQIQRRVEADRRHRERELSEESERALQIAVAEAEERTKKTVAAKVADLEAQVNEKTARIEEATVVELELRRRQREADEKEKNLELEIARKVDQERKKAEQAATDRVTEEFRIREAQTKEQIAAMTRKIDELKRRAEQGSQQIQGEALEVELENSLRQSFPIDDFAPVNKGARGADILHTVRTCTGVDCAAIVWETKSARAWSPRWVEKIREDQRDAKADLAVIVTSVMPGGMRDFGQVDDVWVCDFSHAVVLAGALRAQLQAVQRERAASQGRTSKESSLYDYVIGSEFRQRVAASVASLSQMKTDLDRERNSAIRVFAKREKQIMSAFGQIAELYGGVQGIVGATLPTVALLEAPGDEAPDNDGDDSPSLLAS